MQENIEDIIKRIEIHRRLEITKEVTNSAVGRTWTIYDNDKQQFWIINKEATIVKYQTDFNGNIIVETAFAENSTLKGDGFPVPRDNKLGQILIGNHEGKHKYITLKGEIEIEIFNRAIYTPINDDIDLAIDITIRLQFDLKTYSFQTIRKIISLQNEIDISNEKLQDANEKDGLELINKIAEKEAEKLIYFNKAQNFIRKLASLRYQPILDEIQDAIRRSNIFTNPLIINGGPGTGKTISLIQRIKFLISRSIEEYITLNQVQKDILFVSNSSWIFYTPTNLLAEFLKEAMNKENLQSGNERVKIWKNHKIELTRAYHLVSENKWPFLIFNKLETTPLINPSADNIKKIRCNLNDFYLQFHNIKLKKILDNDVSIFSWKNIGKSIQDYIASKINIKSIDELILFYLNLYDIYSLEISDISKDYKNQINKPIARILIKVQSDTARYKILLNLLDPLREKQHDSEEIEEEDFDLDQEDFEEKEEPTSTDFERTLYIKLKALCRKQALSYYDKNTKLNKRDKILIELIPEALSQPEYDKIGQLAYFIKYFERITKGISVNILREIPMIYKLFRKEQLISSPLTWNIILLQQLVKDKNIRIHADEQAIILTFINEIILKIYNNAPVQYKTLNHPFVNGFKRNCKSIIGIDEATDLSLIDLLAINSLRHPEISSITLSGDLMQRMTPDGITSWNDFINLIPDSVLYNLNISYRQSPTLLELAKDIYKRSTGIDAIYKSFITKDDAEPKPLMLVTENELEKIIWIAKRIHEIYKAYGDLIPSIAIFLADENQLESFATSLGSLDTIADEGILVKACRNGDILGDKNTVRIFSNKVIKGLEFEAVFFHNIDDLIHQNLTMDLFLKYLYVGLSRATFYLGLTLTNELPHEFTFIENHFDKTGKTWQL